MSFEEVRLSDRVNHQSSSVPAYNTRIIGSATGYEQRNSNWEQSRLMFNAAYGVILQNQLDELVNFFHAMKGMATGFRWKDWGDYKSCGIDDEVDFNDQGLLTAAGGETTAQLYKTYTVGSQSTTRTITKPVSGTVRVGKDSGGGLVELTETTDFTVDTTTGIITFVSPLVAADIITAGYEFDVPCRFGSDELSTNLSGYKMGDINVPIVEIRV